MKGSFQTSSSRIEVTENSGIWHRICIFLVSSIETPLYEIVIIPDTVRDEASGRLSRRRYITSIIFNMESHDKKESMLYICFILRDINFVWDFMLLLTYASY